MNTSVPTSINTTLFCAFVSPLICISINEKARHLGTLNHVEWNYWHPPLLMHPDQTSTIKLRIKKSFY